MKSAVSTVKRVVCVGAGYVGGSTMPIIASHAPDLTVTIVDIDEKRINEWNSGVSLPIYEPGLEEIVRAHINKNLFFTSRDLPKAIKEADVIFIAVNTGTKEYGYGAGSAYDLTSWEAVSRSIAKYATEERFYVIVEKSTVPVRTAEQVRRILDASKAPGVSFEVVSNPEFLAEGSAVRNLEEPDRVLIGGLETDDGKRATEMVAEIYAHWIERSRIITTNLWSSELAKLAANAFLAQRLSTVNALSAVCEATGAKIDEVTRVVGTDTRIGPTFLKTSVGWGGSCFKKDINGLVYLCENYHLTEVAEYFRKKILILGYAFKKDTGDTRESPAIDVCRFLTNEGADVHIYDPKVPHEEIKELFPKAVTITDVYEGAKAAHAVVVLTEWDEFKSYDYAKLYASMYRPAFLFDGRNILDHAALTKLGFQVYAVGERGPQESI